MGEGVDEAPSDSEEEDIVELTRPAAGEGAEGGHDRGMPWDPNRRLHTPV